MFRKPELKPKAMLSLGVLLLITPVLLIAFQNCSQFSVSDAVSKLSASCSAKIQEQAPALAKLLSVTPPDCESPKNYVCLVRKFAPDIENSTGEFLKCLDADSKTCVQVTEISFDTAAARNSNYEPKEFESGGEYNRVEAQCSHKLQYARASLFVGLGDDLASAFANAKSKCLVANTFSKTAVAP
jgi:hypothetical protein